jgi:hypothetical protein
MRAFEYFSRIANAHAEDSPSAPQAAVVANAFVALGRYYLAGIPNSKIMADAELAERKLNWKPRESDYRSGALWKYAQQVGPAIGGAVTHPGGAQEKQCYADI